MGRDQDGEEVEVKVVQVGKKEGLEEVAAGAAVTQGGASLSRSCFTKNGRAGEELKKKKGSQHKFC